MRSLHFLLQYAYQVCSSTGPSMTIIHTHTIVDIIEWLSSGYVSIVMLPPNFAQGYLLGFYEPFRQYTNSVLGWNPADQVTFTSVFAGASSGAVGGSPHTSS